MEYTTPSIASVLELRGRLSPDDGQIFSRKIATQI